eukprot:GHVQ01006489.1.p1 GENE.GHVQ01006489.1~~GHVQ01006489.1.p1  ORF type:complete len:522 (+),score=67.64 GHVQ01006489.1:1769-3334(+)
MLGGVLVLYDNGTMVYTCDLWLWTSVYGGGTSSSYTGEEQVMQLPEYWSVSILDNQRANDGILIPDILSQPLLDVSRYGPSSVLFRVTQQQPSPPPSCSSTRVPSSRTAPSTWGEWSMKWRGGVAESMGGLQQTLIGGRERTGKTQGPIRLHEVELLTVGRVPAMAMLKYKVATWEGGEGRSEGRGGGRREGTSSMVSRGREFDGLDRGHEADRSRGGWESPKTPTVLGAAASVVSHGLSSALSIVAPFSEPTIRKAMSGWGLAHSAEAGGGAGRDENGGRNLGGSATVRSAEVRGGGEIFGGGCGGMKNVSTVRVEVERAKDVSKHAPPVPVDSARCLSELFQAHEILVVALCPWGCSLAVVADTLGRVSLVDLTTIRVLHMWKGYRDAQIAWLLNNLPQASQPHSFTQRKPGPHPGTNPSSDPPHKFPLSTQPLTSSGGGRGPCRGGLAIYAPRRGLLELWDTRTLQRVGAAVVNGGILLGSWGRVVFVSHGSGGVVLLRWPHVEANSKHTDSSALLTT